MNTVGIDIGGTKISGVLVDAADQVLKEDRQPTPANDSQAILETVVAMVENLRTGQNLDAVGVAAAGFIDANQSHVVYAPNLN